MKPGMTQRELEAELHAHFGGAREPVEPPSLGDVMRTLPDDPKLRRRGLSGRPAIVALAAVVLLVGGALGLPFLMTGAGAQETPSASAKPSSVADETSTPALSEVPTADATDIVVELPTDMPEFKIPATGINIIDLVVTAGLLPSKTEARRKLIEGAFHLDNQRITDAALLVKVQSPTVLKVGKRRFLRLVP